MFFLSVLIVCFQVWILVLDWVLFLVLIQSLFNYFNLFSLFFFIPNISLISLCFS